jgi:hypothetical protein
MVRRRSTVRFRNGAPDQRGFSSFDFDSRFQGQVTSQVIWRLSGVSCWQAQRDVARTSASLWPAVIRLKATAPGWEQPALPGFGHWPYPLPRECLRFPGCARSRPMKPAHLMAAKAARGRHLRAVTQPDRPEYRGGHPGLVSKEVKGGGVTLVEVRTGSSVCPCRTWKPNHDPDHP